MSRPASRAESSAERHAEFLADVRSAAGPSPLAGAFADAVNAAPDAPALELGSVTLTRAQCWRRLERVTGHLHRLLGAQPGGFPGPRVAWLGWNHELQLLTLLACARLGAVFMPLNFRLATAELRQTLDDAQPTLLLHDTAHQERAQALADPRWQVWPMEGLIDTPSAPVPEWPATGHDTPVLLAYTSGTSGTPKGALHTQGGLLANARASQWAHGFLPGDRVLSVLPLFHVGGLCIQTLPALLAGVPVLLQPRFDPDAWFDAVEQSAPTLSLLVPATLRALIEHPRWPQARLHSLRGVMTGSSTVPLRYLQAFHERGIPVGQVYGSTETGPVSVCLPLAQAVAREGAAGWPQPEAQLRLLDAQGQPVPPSTEGEVCLQAPNLMWGYWNARTPGPDQSPAPRPGLNNGWFATGDMGVAAADGCITIVGRCKDMIISGGENIYPAEIENRLIELPGVAECTVVGRDDPRWGEVPVAVIVRTPDATGQYLTAEQVMTHLADKVARFKWPKEVVFAAQLPKNALGKVQKQAVREGVAGGISPS